MSRSDTRKYKRVLEPELAKLPGEMITHDINNDTKIHPLDPPHIRRHLAKKIMGEWFAEERKKNPLGIAEITVKAHLNGLRKTPDRYKVIDQALVDLYRAVVLIGRARRVMKREQGVERADRLVHIWFNSEKDGSLLLTKSGQEPPDIERPAFLKRLHLTVDINDWPRGVCDMLSAAGLNPQELQDAVKAEMLVAKDYIAAERAAAQARADARNEQLS